MAIREDCDVALLPIKPHFASAIIDGSKRVEFRRQAFARPISHILIYASSPVQRVVGYFRIAKIRRDAPAAIWETYHDVGGISAEEFVAYYDGADAAVAIEVRDLVVLDRPISLCTIKRRLRAPQNYTYLSAAVLRRLRKRRHKPQPN